MWSLLKRFRRLWKTLKRLKTGSIERWYFRWNGCGSWIWTNDLRVMSCITQYCSCFSVFIKICLCLLWCMILGVILSSIFIRFNFELLEFLQPFCNLEKLVIFKICWKGTNCISTGGREGEGCIYRYHQAEA